MSPISPFDESVSPFKIKPFDAASQVRFCSEMIQSCLFRLYSGSGSLSSELTHHSFRIGRHFRRDGPRSLILYQQSCTNFWLLNAKNFEQDIVSSCFLCNEEQRALQAWYNHPSFCSMMRQVCMHPRFVYMFALAGWLLNARQYGKLRSSRFDRY